LTKTGGVRYPAFFLVSIIVATLRFLAEWEKQYCTLLTWPHQQSDWADRLDQIEALYVTLAKTIASHQNVAIVVFNASHQVHVAKLLSEHQVNLDACHFYTIPSNDTWIRDYGPLSVELDKQIFWKNFDFNAWGNKYPWQLDNQITALLYPYSEFNAYELLHTHWILEGGAIETDGYHTVLMNQPAVISESRNPGYSKQTIEEKLFHDLGIQQCLWINAPSIPGDDTDGHIDNIARFINADTIVVHSIQDKKHPDFKVWKQLHHSLQGSSNIAGKPYNLVTLPQPVLNDTAQGSALPASYLNFLFINDALLLPVFDCEQDEIVIELMTNLLPERQILPVNSLALLEQGGGIHCATMQIPQNSQ
jgi:agmatine deiminase